MVAVGGVVHAAVTTTVTVFASRATDLCGRRGTGLLLLRYRLQLLLLRLLLSTAAA